MASCIRLYIDHPLGKGQQIALSRDHAQYLFSVMRLTLGAEVEVFNGHDGAWKGEVIHASKRSGALRCTAQSQPQRSPPDLWLLFAPIKKARTDFIVEKATEMGAAKIIPVQTDFTNSERIKRERLQAHAIEAAEQCGGTYVPKVTELQKLHHVLQSWPTERSLVFCDETAQDQAVHMPNAPAPSAILIGPEGGFSPAERKTLQGASFTKTLSLGPRILRADTAAVAALALWQNHCGDWR